MTKKQKKEGTFDIYFGLTMLSLMLLGGLLVPLLSKYGANEVTSDQMMSPSLDHFFGTDLLGRDVFVRVFSAVFIDLGAAFIGVLIPLSVGTIIGTLLGISKIEELKPWSALLLMESMPSLFNLCNRTCCLSRCRSW